MQIENENLRAALNWLDECPHPCYVSSYQGQTLHIKVEIPLHLDRKERDNVCRDSE